MSNKFTAGEAFPSISLNTVGGDAVDIGKPQHGRDWQMMVIYRGKHCPLCTKYLDQLESLKQQFFDLKIDIITVSGDPKEKAEKQNDGNLTFPVAYGLSIKQMQTLGLYISNPRSPQETDRPFAEPGLFVINDEGKVQVIEISNGPFIRPELDGLLYGLAFIRDPANNYPIRGTYKNYR